MEATKEGKPVYRRPIIQSDNGDSLDAWTITLALLIALVIVVCLSTLISLLIHLGVYGNA